MKKIYVSILTVGMALSLGCAHQRQNSASQTDASKTAPENSVAANRPEALDRLNDSATVLDELMAAPDDAIPGTVLSGAECVMVIPSMVKGGFIVGGRHGRGVVTCKQGGRFTNPAFVTITGGSFGPQIGAASVDLVLLFMSGKGGMDALLKNNFEIGADASVAAGPFGRSASAGTDVSMNAQILSYSRAKGLFAGLELGGASVREDGDSNKGFYGREVSLREILSGKLPNRVGDDRFMATVRKHFREAGN
jgi:lipid-binding SYLF domain-containing protein